jgi:hypothetical protein
MWSRTDILRTEHEVMECGAETVYSLFNDCTSTDQGSSLSRSINVLARFQAIYLFYLFIYLGRPGLSQSSRANDDDDDLFVVYFTTIFEQLRLWASNERWWIYD